MSMNLEMSLLRKGNNLSVMARRNAKIRKDPRSKNIRVRKGGKRAQGWMESPGFRESIKNPIQSHERHLDSLSGNEKAFECRKTRDIRRGEELGNKEERKEQLVDYPSYPDTQTFSLKELEEDRGKIYGDPFLSHQAIGLAWEGVFRNRYHGRNFITVFPVEVGKLFPADLVAEMLAAFKIVRLARPVYHADSANDARVYIDFSQRFREGK